MKKLIVFGLILGLLAAADLWVKGFAEERIAAELQSSFDDGGEAKVELSGFPITLRLLSGSIPSVRVSSSSLKRRGIRLTDVRMTMQDVRFSLAEIVSGEIGSVRVADGHGRAAIPTSALAGLFAEIAGGIEVEVDENGLSVRAGPIEATAQLALDGTRLVLQAPRLERDLSLDLPRFIEGLQYRSVRLTGAEVVLEFSLEDSSFGKL